MAKRSYKNKATSKAAPAPPARKEARASGLPPGLNPTYVWGSVLGLFIILTYSPVWFAGFVWDDDGRITMNPCIVGPLGLKEVWTTSKAADLCPLTITTFWVEHGFWGLIPLPYHLVNVGLHIACALLLWRILTVLRVPGAWLGAALWSLHPVQVETVAWVTETKNTLSGLFYLLTILFFLKFLKAEAIRGDAGWNRGWTFVFAALALASKSSTVMLPIVLGLCAWWVEGRWQWRNLKILSPIALMATLPAALTLWGQKVNELDPLDVQWDRSWPERLATAGDAVWFYLGKLAWPHPLIFIYPRWQVDAGQWLSYLPLVAVLLIFFSLGLAIRTWSRPYFFTYAYFLAALLPVLGLIDGYFWRYSLVADHFQYLASMGPLALVGAGMVRCADGLIPARPFLRTSLCAVVLIVPSLLSWQQAWAYESVEKLWADTLSKNPGCWLAHNNLGVIYLQRGDLDQATAQFRQTLEIYPGYHDAHFNLGMALAQSGKMDEAIIEWQTALKIKPNMADCQVDLGNALLLKGQNDDAISCYQKAIQSDPGSVDAYNNLGYVLLQKGEITESIAKFQQALKIAPSDARARKNLADAQILRLQNSK